MTENIQKKLAAIMFTSLVEYDEYLKKDEKYAIKVLNEHKKLLNKSIKDYKGNIIKYLDNMCFIEFYSATDAVNCAIAIHHSFKKENSQNPDTFQMNLKIGIHMGEVYEKDNDLFGEGVNLAARVQALAKPSGTVTTQAIYNSIRSEENIFVRDMGRVNLKNIQEPERVFKIYNNEIEYNKETEKELTSKLIKKDIDLVDRKIDKKKDLSIGITYLKNLGSVDEDFFCYGLTQDLITETTKISKIKVPQIDQVLKFKDSTLELNEIASNLDVEYLLSGNIMKMGNNFRLSLELNDVKKDDILWSENWEGNSDVLKNIKGKVMYKMLNSLNIKIPDSLSTLIKKDKEINPEAYEYFIKAKFLSFTSKNKVDLEVVRDLYKKSINLDSNYIEPRYYYAFELVRINELDNAVNILNDALIVAKKNNDNPGIAGVNIVYGAIYKSWGRYEKAIEYYEEALVIRVKEKNLQDEAKVLNGLAQCYASLNKNEEAFKYYNRSIEIKKSIDDKQGVANSLSNLSMYYRRILIYDKAIECSKEALEYFNTIENPISKSRTKMQLGSYQIIVGHFVDAKINLNDALDFMLNVNDFKSIGMIYRNLGIVELNNKDWQKAQDYFIKALNYHKKAEHRPAFEATTLFLGLSYYYDSKYELAEEFINKAVQITGRRTNVIFYGKTAAIAKIMLQTKINQCEESDIDNIVDEIKTIEGCLKREYWYISQSYLNLGLNKKSNKFLKISQQHLEDISQFIENEEIRHEFLNSPLLHRKIMGKDIDSSNMDSASDLEQSQKVDMNSDKSTTFQFCPSCGFNNENNFKFCPQCGANLTS